MYVEICWKTKDTKEGMVHVSKRMTVKEAMKFYKEKIEPHATEAYLRHFDGWHRRIYKTLKDATTPSPQPQRHVAGEG